MSDKAFKIRDRRAFTADGERREDAEISDASGQSPPAAEPAAQAPQEIDFITFVLGLGSNALLQMGLLKDPRFPEMTKDLPGAKQTIDILELLETKTRGNLSADEQSAMQQLLTELRLRYVESLRR